jgi:hypothetical protein
MVVVVYTDVHIVKRWLVKNILFKNYVSHIEPSNQNNSSGKDQQENSMKKQLVIIGIVALLVCVGLSGCTQISNTLNPEKQKFIGTWKTPFMGGPYNITMDFLSDGTYTDSLMYSGTWDLKDGKLVITTQIGSSTHHYSFSNNDRTLTLDGTNYTKQ